MSHVSDIRQIRKTWPKSWPLWRHRTAIPINFTTLITTTTTATTRWRWVRASAWTQLIYWGRGASISGVWCRDGHQGAWLYHGNLDIQRAAGCTTGNWLYNGDHRGDEGGYATSTTAAAICVLGPRGTAIRFGSAELCVLLLFGHTLPMREDNA